MQSTKFATVVGARPQFVKAAALSRALRALPEVREVMIHTGQHYSGNMSQIFFDELEINAPDYNLEIGSGPHGKQTGQMLAAIEEVLMREKPDWVIVYGDTNSTLAGALAAVKLHYPVAHVEGGLRSFNPRMPEEINRILTDQCSTLIFAPTENAQQNLTNAGISPERIHITGDIMYDATLHFAKIADKKADLLGKLNLAPGDYILATVHRAENTDCIPRLRTILKALQRLAEEMPVVLPLHPRTRNVLGSDLAELTTRLQIIEPVGYLEMLILEKNARLVMTDSGGVQKEAFFHHVPCVTLRDETEWVELVEMGWNHLAGPDDFANIVSTAKAALRYRPEQWISPYGDGRAAERMSEILLEQVSRKNLAVGVAT